MYVPPNIMPKFVTDIVIGGEGKYADQRKDAQSELEAALRDAGIQASVSLVHENVSGLLELDCTANVTLEQVQNATRSCIRLENMREDGEDELRMMAIVEDPPEEDR